MKGGRRLRRILVCTIGCVGSPLPLHPEQAFPPTLALNALINSPSSLKFHNICRSLCLLSAFCSSQHKENGMRLQPVSTQPEEAKPFTKQPASGFTMAA